MTAHQPSLLVFARTPASECAQRRLLPRRFDGLTRSVLRESLDAALTAGRTSGCRLQVATTEPQLTEPGAHMIRQTGASFGERFRNALSAARLEADGPVVAVGSDVPGLESRHVREALGRLGSSRRRVVLGPSPDGGFYLLATNICLDAELASVHWCCHATLATLRRALEERGLEVYLLEPLRDLDRARDLLAWIAREQAPRWQGLLRELRAALLALCTPLAPALVGVTATGYRPTRSLRGPPA